MDRICRMGRIGGPLGKSLGGTREALCGTLGKPFAAPRSLLHRRDAYPVPAQRHRRSGATPSPFRRNGITVPAQRHRRSGATPSPFRRNGITVPARLDTRLKRSRRAKRGGQTGEPRFSVAICLFHEGFRLKTQTNGRFHACNRSVLMPRGIFSHRHKNSFSWA